MKYRMLDILRCPSCAARLDLAALREVEDAAAVASDGIESPRCRRFCGRHEIALGSGEPPETIDCSACYAKEVEEGVLVCACGALYAVTGRVPRFLEQLDRESDLYRQYAAHAAGRPAPAPSRIAAEAEAIRETFGVQWEEFDYEQDRVWGWTLEDRKEAMASHLQVPKSWFPGQLLLDAGCGIGTLTAAISDWGVETVGIDVTNGVLTAEREKTRLAPSSSHRVHYVQGDLMKPPFEPESFDAIYSYGVLHHTPDTRATFGHLAPLVRPEGRMFVWLYRKRRLPMRLFMRHGRWLARHVSRPVLWNYCRVLAFFLLPTLNLGHYRKRTHREFTLDLFDMFAPRWNYTHSEEEMVGWFGEEGFREASASTRTPQGIGVCGVR